MATTIGRLMPNRTPATEANEKFVIKTDTISTEYQATFNLTPARVKSIVEQAELIGEVGPLFSLYDRMETTDTRYGGLVKQLKAAIGGFRLKVTPAKTVSSSEKVIAEDYANVMREVVTRLDAQSVTKGFTDPHFIGSRLYKLRWELQDFPYDRKLWMPVEIAPVAGEALVVEKDTEKSSYGKLKVRTEKNTEGELIENLPLGSSILLESEYAQNRYAKLGVARKCLPWYLGIQYVQSWWVQYVEGYGSPLRIGRYPRGVDRKSKIDMERFLKVLGQHGYALLPNDMELQLLESNRQGTITTYGDFIGKGHEEYAIAILGQASTVGSKGSAAPYAGAVVANSIRYETLTDVANMTSNGWEAVARLVMEINYGPNYIKRLMPKVAPVLVTPAEMSAKAAAATQASAEGVPVPLEFWFEQVLGIEPTEEGMEAIKYGQVYVVGETEPEAPAVAAERQAKEAAKKQEEADKRSVSTATNDQYQNGDS